jgi:hypothetical protein
MGEFVRVLLLMLCGHALADYPLQGDFLAKGKNPWLPLPGVPWFWCMSAHCLIHGLAVYLVTGSLAVLLMEAVGHFAIDLNKCRGNISFNADQGCHVGCKVLWAFCMVVFGSPVV